MSSKSALYSLLQSWYRERDDPTIGDIGTYGGKGWIWLDFPDLPRRARMNADTKREAVRNYLHDATRRGPEVPWRVIANRRGSMNKVIFTDDGRDVPGWYCYLV